MISIVGQIFEWANKNPGKKALQNGKTAWTYSDLAKKILDSQRILSEFYGIRKGNRVILSADKQLEFVPVYLACHLLEAVALPIAPDTNLKRYEHIRDKAVPSLIIGFDDHDDGKGVPNAKLAEIVSNESVQYKDVSENISFPNLDSVADIIFTTGTTGEPKGVQLSHRNIAAAARNINSFIKNGTDEVEMLALPISHSFGLGRMRCVLSNGQTLVMLGSFANVKRFFRFMDEYHVSGFGMVPASWALLKKLSGDRISHFMDQLNYIEIGSAPMPMEEKRHLMELLPNTRICMHYGLTEASRSAFIEFHSEKNYLNTVGKETPNMHISIRDENGYEIPAGEEGEICVSGDAVTVGYMDQSKEESFWGDSFRTGDWGSRDTEGYITLKSRKKELINVGGKKVSPIEVEEVLKGFDFVEDCVCVGAEDPNGILGEVVKAFIVTSDPKRVAVENFENLIGARLEAYKHPTIYEVIDEVPKTSSGKVQRLLLK